MQRKNSEPAHGREVSTTIKGDKDCGVRSAAPAFIWAYHDPDLAEDNCGATIIAHENIQQFSQKYVRADIYEKIRQELDGVVKMIGE